MMSRRLLLGRGLLGALLAPLAGPAAVKSAGARLATGVLASGRNAAQSGALGVQVGGGGGARALSDLWWNRHRWEAEDQVLAAGHTLPVDVDVSGLRSLSPMAQQRIMRKRWVERRLAERTAWDRAAAIFDKSGG